MTATLLRRSAIFWLTLFLAGAGSGRALTPYLVKDIDPTARPDSSDPRSFASLGAVSLFTATGQDAGAELWASNGTAAGTFLLADTCPGPCSGSPSDHVAAGGGASFFRAAGGLWVTRGTPESTFRLTDAATSLARVLGALTGAWVPEQRLYYFTASDGDHGFELWRTDGTSAGTYQVDDIRPGAQGALPLWLTAYKGRVFFSADDGSGPALWSSDGTAGGTRLVKDAHPGAAQTLGPAFFEVLGNKLVFFFTDADLRVAPLWVSDGTTRGTIPLPGPEAASPGSLMAKTGRFLFFRGGDRKRGAELWVTDGTSRGTRPVTSFSNAHPFVFEGQPRIVLGNRYVFPVNDGAHGVEPWITDGTPAGTRLLKDICPGACSSNGFPRIALNGRLYFEATTAPRGTELWVTDGTPAGTRLVKDICRGACSSLPETLAAVGNRVLFAATDSRTGRELWATDGTPAGTIQLTELARSDPFGDVSESSSLPGGLLFSANDGAHGDEIWRTDGTPAGTQLVADIAPFDVGGSRPCALQEVGGRLLFFADDGLHGKELWTSDGTEAGTRLLQDILPGPGFSHATYCPDFEAVEAAGQILFLHRFSVSAFPSELWRSDGTTEGTFAITDDSHGLTAARDLRSLGASALFFGLDLEHGTELWRSDGTAAGTRLLKEIYPGSIDAEPREPYVFQGRLYFSAQAPDVGTELWASDGTAEGTVLVKDLVPGSFDSDPEGFVELGGKLYFFARTASGQERSLWVTNGTAAGTHAVVEMPGEGFWGSFAVADGSRLFLFGRTRALGPALWVTDGTAAGTRLAAELDAEPAFSDSLRPTAYHSRVYFTEAGSPDHPKQLQVSDGTAEGTGIFHDSEGWPIFNTSHFQEFAGHLLFVSSTSQEVILYQSDGTEAGASPFRVIEHIDPRGTSLVNPVDLVPAGGRLFFPALDAATGRELWALTPD